MDSKGKRQMVKRWLSIALAFFVFCVCGMPVEAETSGYLTYTISYGKVTITDCDTAASGELVIPAEIGGYPVTSIGMDAFQDCSSLTSIEIPESVTSIGLSAFDGCSSLESIEIPESVTSIGDSAFDGCSSLTSIEIPESVRSIGWATFAGCSSLMSIEIPESVTSIGLSTFDGCSSLTSIEIPESVERIGNQAFRGCSSLESIEIPESVTSIGSYAFDSCSSLKSIVIPEGVESIGYQAFGGCSSLTSVEIPKSVTSIGGGVFYGCSSLKSIVIPEGVESIDYQAFYGCSSLTSVEIPEGVTNIGDYAFDGCSSLTSVEIPESVTSIGGYAFDSCSSLTSVEIPEGVTSIGSSAFSGCSSLESIEIPESVTNIGGYAFNDCSSLTSIEIPESVTSIMYGSFWNCSSLESIEIPESVTSIYQSAFYGCSSLKSIVIPEGVTSIMYDSFRNCSSLESIEIPKSVTSIGDSAFYGCSSLESIEIPESVTSIGNSAFYGCSSLESIEIPEGVTSIMYDTFRECSSLTSVEIPEDVTSIENCTFWGCSSLTSIEIPEGIKRISHSTFRECSSLEVIVIPEGVTKIGDYAFYGCSGLKCIKLPKSVNYIEEHSLLNCPDVVVYLKSFSVRDYVTSNDLTYVKIPDSIEVTTMPEKIQYCVGEELDLEGIIINANCFDGTEEINNENITFEGFDSSKAGSYTVKVIYVGLETSFDVTINENHTYADDLDVVCDICEYVRTLEKIEILSMPDKLSYRQDEALELNGLTLKLYYSDETTAVVDTGYEVDEFDSTYAGKYEITVYYGEKTTSFKVIVEAYIAEGITLDKQTIIGRGEQTVQLTATCTPKLPSAEKLEWSSSDESIATVDDHGKVVLVSEGTATITVSIGDKQAECAVTVVEGKWVSDSKGYRYEYYDGSYLYSEWKTIDGILYYFNASGYRAEGWEEIDGVWYYFNAVGLLESNKWIGKYYVNEDGIRVTSAWVDNGRYYVDETGAYVSKTGWYMIDGEYYYLKSGKKQTGWLQAGTKWYYLDPATGVMLSDEWLRDTYYFKPNGSMATGWMNLNGDYYYFNGNGAKVTNQWAGNYYLKDSGIMATNEWVDDGKYYVNASGAYVSKTGWFKLDGEYYYLKSGKKQTGWLQEGSKWYYLEPSTGIMLTDEWLRDTYYFRANGAMATGWVSIDGDYYYFNSGGSKVTSMWVGNYYLRADGVMAANEWVDDGKYYVNGSGVKVTTTGWFKPAGDYYYLKSGEKQHGWLKVGSKWYYFHMDTGIMYADEWLDYNYYFASNGAMVTGWQVIGEDAYYFNSSGKKLTSQWVDDYYLDSEGKPLEGYPKSISLDCCPDLEVGETYELSVTLSPADADMKYVTWESSDESIATVENGIVKAIAVGSATISATVNGIQDSCSVTVKEFYSQSADLNTTSGDSYVNFTDINSEETMSVGEEIQEGEADSASINVVVLAVELETPLNTTTSQVQLKVTNMTDSEVEIQGIYAGVTTSVDLYPLYNINGVDTGTVKIGAYGTETVVLAFATDYADRSLVLDDNTKISFDFNWKGDAYQMQLKTNGTYGEIKK